MPKYRSLTISTTKEPLRVTSSPLTDAPSRNIVDVLAPAWFKPWARLMRIDRPIGVWLLLWPCWWSVALAVARYGELPTPRDLENLCLFAVGAFAMRSAGCIYNDIIDRDIDAKVFRTRNRPLAAREISVRSAAILGLAMCLIGLLVLLQFNPFAIAVGFASVGIVLIYPLMKRVTFWPQAVLGLAFSWGALMGWAVTFGSLAPAPLFLYLAAVAWTIGYDTIYAHQDREDDAVMGMKSTALLFGDKTWMWLLGIYGAVIVFLALAGIFVEAGPVFFVVLGFGALQLFWQTWTLDVNDAENCLRRFRSNHGFGAIVFAALSLDVITLAVS